MKTIIINSFEEYINYIEKYKNKFLFRGQANRDWGIEPSLFRDDSLVKNEINIIKQNKYFDEKHILPSIFKMQHYGTPTRLLDLTISPYSALFFAIDDETQLHKDGVVYVIDKSKNMCFLESDIEMFCNLMLDDTLGNRHVLNEEIKCLSKDYIIQYDYNFAYTNNRAMLQGGTALIAGFDVNDSEVRRKKALDLNPLILEKIIIPYWLKPLLLKSLNNLGFSKSILYENFETNSQNSNIEFTNVKFTVTKKAFFNKIVATYSVNTIDFNGDCLACEIIKLHDCLLKEYGDNARIWLYFCIDVNDIQKGNWICRGTWSEKENFQIVWTKDYYKNRLRYINEEVSKQEVIESFKPLINQAFEIEKVIKKVYLMNNYQKIIEEFYNMVPIVNRCWHLAMDVPYGDATIEQFSKIALKYISEVERLIRESVFYIERPETEKFIIYWIDILLKDCEKCREKLSIYKKYYI